MMRFAQFCVLFAFCVQYLSVNAVNEQSCPKLVNYRLTKDVKPTNYVFSVKPNHVSLSFDGVANITIRVKKETNEITLHSASRLVIENVRIHVGDRTVQGNVTYCSDEGTATFVFPESIKEGKAVLRFKFFGAMDEKKNDIYRIKQVDEKKYGAVAKFQPTYSIPCFDEPAFKAKLTLSVVIENNKTVISNMPVKSKKSFVAGGLNLTKYTFEKSPPLPTYMTAMIDGFYDYVEKKLDNHSLPIRVYTPKGYNESGLFALNVTSFALPFFINYFNESYPLPKLDVVGVDTGDSSGLENWGVLTFENTHLLVGNDSSNEQKHELIVTLCRKLSHQWIGGLVTIDWLTQSWLFQGINTLLQYKCIQSLYPQWKVWNNFLITKTSPALDSDAKKSAKRLQKWINNPELFALYYDSTSHAKGAAVVRMIEDWIGSENFTKGVRLFVQKHKFGTAKTKDFWNALKNVTNLPIDKVVQTWINEPGYPLVTVSKPNCTICPGFVISQQKFNEDGVLSERDSKVEWTIPINYIIDNKTVSTTLLESKTTTIVAKNKQNNFILVNPASRGMYRTQYYKEVYDELFKLVQSKTLDDQNRFKMQNNFFALAKAGKESTADYLNYLKAYVGEEEDFIWFSIDSSLTQIRSLVENTDIEKRFNAFVRKLVGNVTTKVHWEQKANESWSFTIIRPMVLYHMSLADDEAVVKKAFAIFEDHWKNKTLLRHDLYQVVYRTVIAHNMNGVFEHFLEMYKNSNFEPEKALLRDALGTTKNETQILKLLDFAMSNHVSDKDTVPLLLSVTSTATGRQILWDYFLDYQTELRTLFETGPFQSYWFKLIHGMVSSFSCLKKANEIERYFEDNPSIVADVVLKNALEAVRMKAQWYNRDYVALREFLDSREFV